MFVDTPTTVLMLLRHLKMLKLSNFGGTLTVSGLSLDCLPTVSGLSLECLWTVSGLSLNCLLNVCEMTLDCLWTVSGLSLGQLTDCLSEFFLDMTVLILYTTGFFSSSLNMTGVVLNMTVSVLSTTRFVLNITVFVLNTTGLS